MTINDNDCESDNYNDNYGNNWDIALIITITTAKSITITEYIYIAITIMKTVATIISIPITTEKNITYYYKHDYNNNYSNNYNDNYY